MVTQDRIRLTGLLKESPVKAGLSHFSLVTEKLVELVELAGPADLGPGPHLLREVGYDTYAQRRRCLIDRSERDSCRPLAGAVGESVVGPNDPSRWLDLEHDAAVGVDRSGGVVDHVETHPTAGT